MNETGLEKSFIGKYLSVLDRLQLVEREVPVTEKMPEKSKKGLYKISDNFLKFWFRFIYNNKSEIEIGNMNYVIKKIMSDFSIFQGWIFENIAREFLTLNRQKIFEFSRIGKWWDKNEEIDIVCLNDDKKEALFGEVKWTNKKIGVDIYQNLKQKTALVDWNNKNRKEKFILFAKSGFTKDMLTLAKSEGVFLVNKNKIIYKP